MSDEVPSGSGSRPKRQYKSQQPTWIPKGKFQDKVGKENEERTEEKSGNIVEGLLEIVNMITDNPGLKTDLQEYFTESKRKGRTRTRTRSKKRWSRKDRRSRARQPLDVDSEEEETELEDLMKDYRSLVEKQESEEADLDGVMLPPTTEALQGFKKTFTTVDSYQEMPMEIDSDDEDDKDSQMFPFPPPPPPPPPSHPPLLTRPWAPRTFQEHLRHPPPGPPRHAPHRGYTAPYPFYFPPDHNMPRQTTHLMQNVPGYFPSQQDRYDWNVPTQTYAPFQPPLPAEPHPNSSFGEPPPLLPTNSIKPEPLPAQQGSTDPIPAQSQQRSSDPIPAQSQQRSAESLPENSRSTHPTDPRLQGSPLQRSHSPEDLPPPTTGPSNISPQSKQVVHILSSDSDESYAEDSIPSEDNLSSEEKEEQLSNMGEEKPSLEEDINVVQDDKDSEEKEDDAASGTSRKTQNSCSSDSSSDSSDSDSSSDSTSSSSSSSEEEEEETLAVEQKTEEEKKSTPPEVPSLKDGSEDEEINSKYNLLDSEEDEGDKEEEEKDKAKEDDKEEEKEKKEEEKEKEGEENVDGGEDEDVAALRTQLLHSIKKNKESPGTTATESNDKVTDRSPDKAATNQEPIVVSDNSEEDAPLVKRISKRKMSARTFTLEETAKIINALPATDDAAFQRYYATKRQKKKARQRARLMKLDLYDLMKEELYFDPQDELWFVHHSSNGAPPKACYSWVRLAKHMLRITTGSSSSKKTKTPDKSLQDSRKRRLEKFYQLTEGLKPRVSKPDSGSKPTVKSTIVAKQLDPKEIKITIMKDEDNVIQERDDGDSKFKSTFTAATASTEPSASPKPLVSLRKTSARSLPTKKPIPRVLPPEGDARSVLAAKRTRRRTAELSAPECTEQRPSDKSSASQESLRKSGDVVRPRRKSSGGRRDRKVSEEEDLDGMREILLQSMIKKHPKDGKENMINIETKKKEIVPTKMKSALPIVEIKSRGSANASPNTSPPRPTTVPPAIPESLMPRDISSTTPEAIQRSYDNTRKIISRLLVNEDLRLPQKKDTKLDPDVQKEKERELKRITPKIKPIIIKLDEPDSESESESHVTTPVKIAPSVAQSPVESSTGNDSVVSQKLLKQRNDLTCQIAQLERRLVQYTLKKNQHLEEHKKHTDKVSQLEGQLERARAIVRKSEEIIKTFGERHGNCMSELKVANNSVQKINLRINNPKKWLEEEEERARKVREKTESEDKPAQEGHDVVASSEELPKCDETIASHDAPEKLSDATEKLSDVAEESSDKEPGELESDCTKSSSSSEEETESIASQELDNSLDSAETLLVYCLTLLQPAPSPLVTLPNPSPVQFKSRPILHRSNVVNTVGLTCTKYRSPLTIFRSYRFCPYFRSKSQFALSSPTFSHCLKPEAILCPHDLHGKCYDKSCRRQHLSAATAPSGARVRTQLCVSAGLKPAEAKKFEGTHKSLSDKQMTLLFCDHLNSLRKERKRDYYFVNTQFAPSKVIADKGRPKYKERMEVYNSATLPANQTFKYERPSARYCTAAVSEESLEAQCKAKPKVAQTWLDLAQCQLLHGRGISTANATLSKALQFNKHSHELWAEYLKIKSSLSSTSDLRSLYQQALKLAPSPALWKNLAPKLNTFGDRLNAINTAIKMCDFTKPKDRECYGELRKDKLHLIFYAGFDTAQELRVICQDLDKLHEDHLVWFVRQYLSYLSSKTLTKEPFLLDGSEPTPPRKIRILLDVITVAVNLISSTKHLLILHRLYARLLAQEKGKEAAITYLSEVTEKFAELYELMEDIIELGGWVEPDIPWPKLVYLQMQAAVESGHQDTAQILSRDLVKTLAGSTSDSTIQLYREILGLTIGAQVKSDLACFARGMHRTWLFMCFSLTASLVPTDPILEYKLFSTRLALVHPTSAQLNALRYAISTEATSQGAQILWTRYLEVLELELEKDSSLADVVQSEMIHCLKTVPTLSKGNYTFHNKVLYKLLSHYPSEESRCQQMREHLAHFTNNHQLLLRYCETVQQSNPTSAVQQIREQLRDNPCNPVLWAKLLEVGQGCLTDMECRYIARDALSNEPLNASLLLQVLVFELRNTAVESERQELAIWAFQRALQFGINLRKK